MATPDSPIYGGPVALKAAIKEIARLTAESERLDNLCADLSHAAGIQAQIDAFEFVKAERDEFHKKFEGMVRLNDANLECYNNCAKENATLKDNASIGLALLDSIKLHRPNYHWNECPSEIVLSLCNELSDLEQSSNVIKSRAEAAEAREKVLGAPLNSEEIYAYWIPKPRVNSFNQIIAARLAAAQVCKHKWVCRLDQQQCQEDCHGKHDLVCDKCGISFTAAQKDGE
jgi:hypothetical protein